MVTEGNRGISFVIEKRLGVLSVSSNGWRKELNLVSWNGRTAKLDIREWSPDHEKMAKGITLRTEEAQILQKSLYRWLTGYGKPQVHDASETPPADTEAVSADESVPFEPQEDLSDFPETMAYPDQDEIPEYGAAEEEPLLCDPETGEVSVYTEENS